MAVSGVLSSWLTDIRKVRSAWRARSSSSARWLKDRASPWVSAGPSTGSGARALAGGEAPTGVRHAPHRAHDGPGEDQGDERGQHQAHARGHGHGRPHGREVPPLGTQQDQGRAAGRLRGEQQVAPAHGHRAPGRAAGADRHGVAVGEQEGGLPRIEDDDAVAVGHQHVRALAAALAEQRHPLAGQQRRLLLQRVQRVGALGAAVEQGGGEQGDPGGRDQGQRDGHEEPPAQRPGAGPQGATAL